MAKLKDKDNSGKKHEMMEKPIKKSEKKVSKKKC